MATAAPAKAPARKPPARKPAPARKKAPTRKPAAKKATARKAAARKAPAGAARSRGVPAARPHLVPLAVGHTAAAVRGLPDCRPVLRLTRGRAWIALLGLMLAGIVALNVVTLNLTATAGDIEAQRQVLREENSLLERRLAERLSNGRVEGAAASLGFERPDGRDIAFATAGPETVRIAAERLAALD
jgi:hypothetical protein